jgi:hypothetical protein
MMLHDNLSLTRGDKKYREPEGCHHCILDTTNPASLVIKDF